MKINVVNDIDVGVPSRGKIIWEMRVDYPASSWLRESIVTDQAT